MKVAIRKVSCDLELEPAEILVFSEKSSGQGSSPAKLAETSQLDLVKLS